MNYLQKMSLGKAGRSAGRSGAGDLTKGAIVGRVWIAEVGVVEHIEVLGAELQIGWPDACENL